LPANAKGSVDPVTGMLLAGWWRRVGATFADNLILILPSLFVYSLFGQLWDYPLGFVMAVAFQGFYTVRLLKAKRGQTVGNMVAASRVRDGVTGGQISRKQALIRWAPFALYAIVGIFHSEGALLAFILVLGDSLYPLYDPRNRTIHDRLADTIVVIA
jgi:uncharacterized RDD family membrane protein YckC